MSPSKEDFSPQRRIINLIAAFEMNVSARRPSKSGLSTTRAML